MNTSAHIVVRGMVQGVGFRYFVQHHARLLNLGGWVRNLPNGDVEIEVEGDQASVESLIVYTRRGPRSAVVSNVDIKWKEPHGRFTDFTIDHW
ncbi:MAG TPA: acylphosphatase [Terriglobia bacterium]|nr:acylphosphatase [Terriglobia bacterium]